MLKRVAPQAFLTTHTLGAVAPPGELRAALSDAVRDAIRDLVGPDAADRLVAGLWLDLDETRPHRRGPR